MAVFELDTKGMSCPLPLLKAKNELSKMASGEKLKVLATDRGSIRDFKVYAEKSGNTLLSSEEHGGIYIYLLEKV